jgi:hypothetical protein
LIEWIDNSAKSITDNKRSRSLGYLISTFWTRAIIYIPFLHLGKREMVCQTTISRAWKSTYKTRPVLTQNLQICHRNLEKTLQKGHELKSVDLANNPTNASTSPKKLKLLIHSLDQLHQPLTRGHVFITRDEVSSSILGPMARF